MLGWFIRLRLLWVDDGYSGSALVNWVKALPRRWVAGRAFGWLMHHRRLVRNHKRTISSAENFIYIA